jgi:Fe-S-cluster containining protein
MFICSKCGACCTNLDSFNGLYYDLDDGSGCCRHLDIKTKLCKIYDTRPEKCRVKSSYKNFDFLLAYDEYLNLTVKGCEHLRLRESHKK